MSAPASGMDNMHVPNETWDAIRELIIDLTPSHPVPITDGEWERHALAIAAPILSAALNEQACRVRAALEASRSGPPSPATPE